VVGCLSIPILGIMGGLISWYLFDNFWEGACFSLVAAAASNMGLMKLAERRNRLMIERWATERSLTVSELHPPAGFFTPDIEWSWWTDWAAYDMKTIGDDGAQYRFNILVVGVLGLFHTRLRVSIHSPADYVSVRFSGDELAGLSLEESLSVFEEKSKAQGPHPIVSALREDPTDANRWRVYADHLEERGDRRAGYIRQCPVLPGRWSWILGDSGDKLVQMLKLEAGKAHALYGKPVIAMAHRLDSDDVLFEVDGAEGFLAVVHLTWAESRGADPRWPHTTLFSNWQVCLEHLQKEVREERVEQ